MLDLLPEPKRVASLDGVFALKGPLSIHVPSGVDPRVRRLAERVAGDLPVEATLEPGRDCCAGRAGRHHCGLTISDWGLRIGFSCRTPNPQSAIHNPQSPIRNPRTAPTQDFESAEAYRITIEPDEVVLEGASPAGLFYALQTLRQIAETQGLQWRCCEIEDAPDLPLRGLSYDVSRGKVPTIDTFKWLVDRISSFKMNHLQLYVEHTFDFQFDPDISHHCSPLTGDDIQTIQAYCRDHFIDLVPSLATLGHMGRILSLPQYRTLAEVECVKPWVAQSWPERMRGLTIDVTNPASRNLLNSMLDEYLPLFDSRYVNVCCDEPHDLGHGKTKSVCRRRGRAHLFLNHLDFLAGVCRRHGKRMMLWGDVLRKNPELMGQLPEDAVVLDWDYEADARFDVVSSPDRKGLEVCVCPGTNCWNRLVGAMGLAEANIAAAVEAGREHHATGLIVTDWGDHGHFHPPAIAMPPIARAAAGAWNAEGITGPQVDRAIGRFCLGDSSGRLLPALRNAARVDEAHFTWCALYQTTSDPEGGRGVTAEVAHTLEADASEALEMLREDRGALDIPIIEIAEWRFACQACVLLAQKVLLAHDELSREDSRQTALRRLAEDVNALRTTHNHLWQARNKPDRFRDLDSAIERCCSAAADCAGSGDR